MKLTGALILSAVCGTSAFAPLSQSRPNTRLNYGWNDYQQSLSQPAAPAPAYPPAQPAQPAYPAAPAAPAYPAAPAQPAAPAYPPAQPAAPAAPAAYAPPAQPAAPPAPAAPAPPASPPSPEEIEEDEPMSKAWAAKVTYDPSQDVFPVFPPHYKTFDQIWAEFQAAKAAGQI